MNEPSTCQSQRDREREGERGRERGATDVTMRRCIDVYRQSLREQLYNYSCYPVPPLPSSCFLVKRLELFRTGV